MNKRLVTLTILASTLALASCGASDTSQGNNSYSAPLATPAPQMDPDDLYTAVIQSQFPSEYSILGRDFVIKFGHLSCDAIDNGTTIEGFALMAQEYNVDPSLLGGLIGAAIPAYCPWNSGYFG